jgi:hypothetical protein
VTRAVTRALIKAETRVVTKVVIRAAGILGGTRGAVTTKGLVEERERVEPEAVVAAGVEEKGANGRR